MFSALFLISTLVSSIAALPNPEAASRRSALPTQWYHKRDHPVHDLFRRADPLPVVGSPAWQAAYPQYGVMPESNIPPAWLAALHAAEAAQLIPNIAPATSPDGGATVVYPPNVNAGQEPICTAMFQCRHAEDIWDAPSGMIGLSVDDGPVGDPNASPRLYDFLKLNNQKVTHFMIGANILANPTIFLRAFEELGDDIGMHTWLHRHSSLLTNEQLVAEFGWTLQIIHDSTGGRVPRYWRPPYGDADNRVRAVAKHVFGLTTVIWNQDSQDWTMSGPGGTTLPAIQAAFTGWLNGPRSPGLIVLEHEISPGDVTAFINMYPLIAAAGGGAPWRATSIAQLFDEHANATNGEGWYQNADNNTASVTVADIIPATSSPLASQNSTATGTGTPSGTPTTVRAGGASIGKGVDFGVMGGMVMAALLAVAL